MGQESKITTTTIEMNRRFPLFPGRDVTSIGQELAIPPQDYNTRWLLRTDMGQPFLMNCDASYRAFPELNRTRLEVLTPVDPEVGYPFNPDVDNDWQSREAKVELLKKSLSDEEGEGRLRQHPLEITFLAESEDLVSAGLASPNKDAAYFSLEPNVFDYISRLRLQIIYRGLHQEKIFESSPSHFLNEGWVLLWFRDFLPFGAIPNPSPDLTRLQFHYNGFGIRMPLPYGEPNYRDELAHLWGRFYLSKP